LKLVVCVWCGGTVNQNEDFCPFCDQTVAVSRDFADRLGSHADLATAERAGWRLAHMATPGAVRLLAMAIAGSERHDPARARLLAQHLSAIREAKAEPAHERLPGEPLVDALGRPVSARRSHVSVVLGAVLVALGIAAFVCFELGALTHSVPGAVLGALLIAGGDGLLFLDVLRQCRLRAAGDAGRPCPFCTALIRAEARGSRWGDWLRGSRLHGAEDGPSLN
jgi:hypothetical protein